MKKKMFLSHVLNTSVLWPGITHISIPIFPPILFCYTFVDSKQLSIAVKVNLQSSILPKKGKLLNGQFPCVNGQFHVYFFLNSDGEDYSKTDMKIWMGGGEVAILDKLQFINLIMSVDWKRRQTTLLFGYIDFNLREDIIFSKIAFNM